MHAEMTNTIARPLAQSVADFRAWAGLPAWDVPGIVAALSKAKHAGSADELAIALWRLASRGDLKTPAVLADEGPHWRDLVGHARTIRPADVPHCDVEGHGYEVLPCKACASEAAEERAEMWRSRAPVIDERARAEQQHRINQAGAAAARAAITKEKS